MEANDSYCAYCLDRVARHAARLTLVVVVVKVLAVREVSGNVLVIHSRSVESDDNIFPFESSDDAAVGDSATTSVSFKYYDFVSLVLGVHYMLPKSLLISMFILGIINW